MDVLNAANVQALVPGGAARPVLDELADNIAPVSALDHGAVAAPGVDNSQALRAAIVDALTRYPDTLKENRTVYLPAGTYEVHMDRVFSDFNFTDYGLTWSIRQGLRIVGDGRKSTIIKLITNGQEKWFYDNQGIATQKFQDLSFEKLRLETDDPEYGNGFKQWSQGGEKRFRFDDCEIMAGIILQTEGVANADLNRFTNCVIWTYRSMFVLNNPQSVSNGLVNADVYVYRDFVEVRKGGSFWVSVANFEMHPHPTDTITDHFLFNNPVQPGNAQGNAEFSMTDVRLEMHGANKKLVRTTGDSGQMNVNFTRLECGTMAGGSREVVRATGAKRVRFDNCILHQDMLFHAECNNQEAPMGALIQFNDCDTGRGIQLHTRCTVAGTGRIVAEGCVRQDSYLTPGTMEPEDFDYGWRHGPRRSLLPKTKIINIKRRGQVLPVVDATTGNPRVQLPAGSYVKRISINKAAVAGGTAGDYQLHVGTQDKAQTIASSAVGPFNGTHKIDVSDYGIPASDTLELWATGATGHSSTSGGDGTVMYIEYI